MFAQNACVIIVFKGVHLALCYYTFLFALVFHEYRGPDFSKSKYQD
jgi:hypothetical protein